MCGPNGVEGEKESNRKDANKMEFLVINGRENFINH